MNPFILVLFMFLFFPTVAKTEIAFEKELQTSALKFFLENSNLKTGLVRDEALNFKPTPDSVRFRRASIAATGFGLAVIANASTNGEVCQDFGREYALKTLRFASQQVARRKGWFVHFIDWETGERINESEYSTIDTALFLAGALYAGQVFKGTEVESLSHRLYDEVDFQDMLTDGGALPNKLTLTMSYRDQTGYSPTQWRRYAEEMILLLLGLGSNTYPLSTNVWNAWQRQTVEDPHFGKIIGFDKPIFTHQYSQVFVDFRNFQDAFGNYFENAVAASKLNRDVCLNDTHYETFRKGFWGLSAGNSADGYRVYNIEKYNGTVCLACAGASAMYLPEVMGELEGWKKGAYGNKIWGQYGFTDSINLDRNWTAEQVYGITVGPLYLALSNRKEETSVWKLFNQIPEIQTALKKAASHT